MKLTYAPLLLLLSLSACDTGMDMPPLSKEEARGLSENAKTDDPTDWCEIFDWYGDEICDDFCLQPDPDCEVSLCVPDDCGPPPTLAPQLCDDGSLIFASASCEQIEGSCDWKIEAPECPELVCQPWECGPEPLLAPQVCPDGSLLFAFASCEPVDGSIAGGCDWLIDAGTCSEPEPTCEPEACGPPPTLAPQLCEDGSFVFASASCERVNETCDWAIESPGCPEDQD